uniref:Uncharacterized protein n=1 Tax=Arabidopsis thaliana TaxID=3702 RepID=Q56WN5_ARATH|nr:hypothetical protein [Arabidopsis thaliana]
MISILEPPIAQKLHQDKSRLTKSKPKTEKQKSQ